MLLPYQRFFARIAIASLTLATTIAPTANADIVTTQALLHTQEHALTAQTLKNQNWSDTAEAKSALQNLLTRDEVITQLQSYGVSQQQAQDRVANLTQAEAQTLAAKMDAMPAGGNVVLLLVIIILVLLLR